MTFVALVFKNLVRQKIRTSLTVLGISVGITTVVALGVVVAGVKATSEQILRAYDSDFFVAQKGASDLSFSTVAESEWRAVDALPEVQRTIGALFHISKVEGQPFFVTIGVTPEDVAKAGPPLREGSYFSAGATDEIMLGSGAASKLGKGIGDTVTIDERALEVVGIYRAGNLWEDNGAYAPLATVQNIAKKPDVVTVIYTTVKEGYDPKEVADKIEEDFPLLTVVASIGEYSEVDQGIEIMDAMNLAISALAVGIGAIGVMNTMVMSVFERTREIGILRAVGWSGNRIMRMVVGESLLLCVVAVGVGAGLGVLASRAVLLIPIVGTFLEYNLDVFVRALVVAVLVALVGAAYPAARAVRLTPMEALRHE